MGRFIITLLKLYGKLLVSTFLNTSLWDVVQGSPRKGQHLNFTQDNTPQRAAGIPNSTLTTFFPVVCNWGILKNVADHEVPHCYSWNQSTKKFAEQNGAPNILQQLAYFLLAHWDEYILCM
ncbi:hypothetical protein NPIL_445211 [Nephila pilipes]|uniref:Uncharacterized protein n=1 Tax=Nephila pilipes TaxID=299642 RepID=A0A8X6MT62_NEPPI|nr:hypothetical protein NPIL_445211 [Nephila pilipes]